MQRTKRTKAHATAILIADTHLSDATPVCRTDDYLAAQISKLQFIAELQAQNGGCPVLHAGDVFHHWKASPLLSKLAYNYLPGMITVPGNHDLPEHSLSLYEKSALALLEESRQDIQVLHGKTTAHGLDIQGCPFGTLEQITATKQASIHPRILLLHELVWEGKRPTWANGSGYTAAELLKEFSSSFDLIVTGDNHQGFVQEQDHTILVNPGSMCRTTADQIDYRPRCYLYYAETNSAVPVYLPMDAAAVSREHVEKAHERDTRIDAYIERMRSDWELGLSFQKNLEVFFEKNRTPTKVREIIWQSMEIN